MSRQEQALDNAVATDANWVSSVKTEDAVELESVELKSVELSAIICRTMSRARVAASACRGYNGAAVGSGPRFALAMIVVDVTVTVLVVVTRALAVWVTTSEESMTVVVLMSC